MTSPPKIKKKDFFTHVDRHGIYGAHIWSKFCLFGQTLEKETPKTDKLCIIGLKQIG